MRDDILKREVPDRIVEEQNKKSKGEVPSQAPKPERLQCGFYLPKKKRKCAMTRNAAYEYCAEHMNIVSSETVDVKRIPCPIDSRHTIWESDLQKHLTKCDSKPKISLDEWYSLNYNVNCSEESAATEIEDEAAYKRQIESVERAYSEFDELELIVKSHPSLTPRLEEVHRKKHTIQQSSLIGHLKDQNLLLPNYNFLEFGCGKAELSKYLNIALLTDFTMSAKGFGFIDRGVNRMKMDPKIISKSESLRIDPPLIKRTRIDIKDLNLDKFVNDFPKEAFVCVSKHLCGAATDLTLQCILNSSTLLNGQFRGLVVAMCCRHCCDYNQLLPESRSFLLERGFDAFTFKVLTKMATWAVCGRKEGVDENDVNGHISGLTIKEREAVGFKARRVIDESRAYALRDLFNVTIINYVHESISLENSCLIIKPME